ncbi:MAG: L-threonylcarbamoyladenylate synthase [Flavobacteriaceae bacterium]
MVLDKEISAALEVLINGGIILYPTDTVWGIGCDASNSSAVEKIYQLKRRAESKTMICLVANDAMLERHVDQVPDLAYDIIDLAEKPVTIIYDDPKGIASSLISEDNSLAIRVSSDKFCKTLIQKLKRPLVSTSANLAGESTPRSFDEIDQHILKGVDYVVNLNHKRENARPSSIIKLGKDGSVKVIRK